MKVFIFGSTGMLGTYVCKYFSMKGYDIVPISRKDIDLSTVTKSIVMHSTIGRGDVVINCAGLIKQRKDVTVYDFIKVNTMFPHLLAEVCDAKKAKLIHISTDCVFSGEVGDYDESCPHDATDIYGRSKSLGEPENASVIRTSIIGEEKFNRLSLVEWVKSNKGNIVNGFVNHTWNGITCLEFAKICEVMIKEDLFWKSVKHVHSPTIVTKCDLVEAISRIYDLEVEVTPMEAGSHCFRHLKSNRDDVIIEVPELYTQIEEIRKFKI